MDVAAGVEGFTHPRLIRDQRTAGRSQLHAAVVQIHDGPALRRGEAVAEGAAGDVLQVRTAAGVAAGEGAGLVEAGVDASVLLLRLDQRGGHLDVLVGPLPGQVVLHHITVGVRRQVFLVDGRFAGGILRLDADRLKRLEDLLAGARIEAGVNLGAQPHRSSGDLVEVEAAVLEPWQPGITGVLEITVEGFDERGQRRVAVLGELFHLLIEEVPIKVQAGALHLDRGQQRLDLHLVGNVEPLLLDLLDQLVKGAPGGADIVHAVGHGLGVGLQIERHPRHLLEGLVELEIQLPVGDGLKAVADVRDAVVEQPAQQHRVVDGAAQLNAAALQHPDVESSVLHHDGEVLLLKAVLQLSPVGVAELG